MSDLVGNPNCWFSHAQAHIHLSRCLYLMSSSAQRASLIISLHQLEDRHRQRSRSTDTEGVLPNLVQMKMVLLGSRRSRFDLSHMGTVAYLDSYIRLVVGTLKNTISFFNFRLRYYHIIILTKLIWFIVDNLNHFRPI